MQHSKTMIMSLVVFTLLFGTGYAKSKKKAEKQAGFNTVKNAVIKKSKSGYILQSKSKNPGYAMKQLPKTYTQEVTFNFSFRAIPKGGIRNAFLVFGNGTDDKKTVKCGAWIGGQQYAVFQGLRKGKINKELAEKFNQQKKLQATVTVDLKKKTVTMKVGGKTLTLKIKELKKITHYGYWCLKTQSEFGEVKVQGK